MHLHACQLCVKSFVRAWVLKQWTINLSNLSFSICYCIANVKMGPATNDQPQTLHKPDTVVRQNIGSTDSSIPCCFTVYRYAGMMWIPLQNLASLRIGIGIIVNNSRGQSSILHTTLTTFIGRRHGHIGMWWLAPVLWAFTQGQRREHFSIYHRTFHQWNIMKVHICWSMMICVRTNMKTTPTQMCALSFLIVQTLLSYLAMVWMASHFSPNVIGGQTMNMVLHVCGPCPPVGLGQQELLWASTSDCAGCSWWCWLMKPEYWEPGYWERTWDTIMIIMIESVTSMCAGGSSFLFLCSMMS